MRSIAIYLGLALAGALFALGIRELKINRQRKYGLFVSTVLMALYLLGSRYVGAVEPAKSVRESTLGQQEQRQIAELVKTKEWQNFKAFWKKLDEIVPNKDKVKDEKELSYLGEYTGAINSEERNELEKELKVLTSDLKRYEQKGIVNPVALNLLERICMARLSYMAHGFKSMIMRMIPPPSLINEEEALQNLERTIDHLLLLKKKDKVNHDEFALALANIQEEIKAFSILNTRNYDWFYSLGAHVQNKIHEKTYNIEEYIASFEKEYADYKDRRKTEKIGEEEEDYFKELTIMYEKTKQALEKLKPVLPFMNELIADLEQ